MESEALLLPATVGAKTTLMEQVPVAGRICPLQLPDMLKSAALAPVSVMLLILKSPVPLLTMVSDLVEDAPVLTVPKAREVGEWFGRHGQLQGKAAHGKPPF